MSRTVSCAAVLLIALASGCAGAPEKPDWIGANSAKYPATRYLLGRGQGDSPAVARDRARADLAKNFRVSVSEESRDVLVRTARSGGSEAEGARLESEASRSVSARTDQVLEGVRIAESWEEPEGGGHHALAVLDRLQASGSLRQRAAQLDAATREALDQARGGDDLLFRVGAATRAVEAQRERAELQVHLAVLDPSGVGAPPSYDLARLEADRIELLRRVRIAPAAVADPLGGLARAVGAALSAGGFDPEAGEAADYRLDAGLTVTEHPGEAGWRWVRGTLEVTLRDPGGKVRGAHRWDVKASAQQPELARQRAADQVARLLEAELGPVLIGFATAGER